MKKSENIFASSIIILLVLAICYVSNAQSKSSLTTEHSSVGVIPKIYRPGMISMDNRYEFGSVFNKAMDEFYFAINVDGKAEILYCHLNENKEWSEPKTVISHSKYSYNDPFLSPDESELYYISDQPRNAHDTIDDIDIWYSKLENSEWSKPINAGLLINSDKNEYYISFTKKGTMYFASNKNSSESRNHDFDIFTSTRIGEKFQEPIPLGEPINTGRYEADVFIAPDESYIIFCSAKKEGYGSGDLYISFKSDEGNWQPPKNMGPSINTDTNDLCPFVTDDGKYFFYTSNQDIYWVSTEIFEQYK